MPDDYFDNNKAKTPRNRQEMGNRPGPQVGRPLPFPDAQDGFLEREVEAERIDAMRRRMFDAYSQAARSNHDVSFYDISDESYFHTLEMRRQREQMRDAREAAEREAAARERATEVEAEAPIEAPEQSEPKRGFRQRFWSRLRSEYLDEEAAGLEIDLDENVHDEELISASSPEELLDDSLDSEAESEPEATNSYFNFLNRSREHVLAKAARNLETHHQQESLGDASEPEAKTADGEVYAHAFVVQNPVIEITKADEPESILEAEAPTEAIAEGAVVENKQRRRLRNPFKNFKRVFESTASESEAEGDLTLGTVIGEYREGNKRLRETRAEERVSSKEKKEARRALKRAEENAYREARNAALEAERRELDEESAALRSEKERPYEAMRATPIEQQRFHREILHRRVRFCLVSFIFLACQFFYLIIHPAPIYSQQEKRPLAQFPKFSQQSLLDGKFMTDFNLYANDSFIFREFYLSLEHSYRRLLGQRDNGKVYFGKDGYRFQQLPLYDQTQFFNNARNLEKLDSRLEEIAPKTQVFFMPIANKQELNSDKLPRYAPHLEQKAYLKFLQSLCKKLQFVDPSARIRQEKEATFYRNDHHWTSLAAFDAANSLLEAMGFRQTFINQFQRYTVKSDFLGSLYARSGGFFPTKDRIEIWKNLSYEKDPNSAVTVKDRNGQAIRRGLYVPEALVGDTPYDVFIGGENGFIDIESDYAKDRETAPSLLVIKDSFADSMIPFLTHQFAHIYVVDLRYDERSLEQFLETYPDIQYVCICYNLDTFSLDHNFFKLLGA
ncbi:MAG: DHHW family protein [Eubacteriales bacterium]|nr:DHHW family protein [Eubacteriales bacterium]